MATMGTSLSSLRAQAAVDPRKERDIRMEILLARGG
jgi:hypothetical protein